MLFDNFIFVRLGRILSFDKLESFVFDKFKVVVLLVKLFNSKLFCLLNWYFFCCKIVFNLLFFIVVWLYDGVLLLLYDIKYRFIVRVFKLR